MKKTVTIRVRVRVPSTRSKTLAPPCGIGDREFPKWPKSRAIVFISCDWGSAVVDSSGRELNRNRVIALLSAIVLEEVSSLFQLRTTLSS
ncbi:hypothetical protein AKJ16_DCAP25574 [Drosera capensis]